LPLEWRNGIPIPKCAPLLEGKMLNMNFGWKDVEDFVHRKGENKKLGNPLASLEGAREMRSNVSIKVITTTLKDQSTIQTKWTILILIWTINPLPDGQTFDFTTDHENLTSLRSNH
jgi:hypothetical protein